MDVTETPRLHEGHVPKVGLAYPTVPTHQTEVNQLIKNLVLERFVSDLTYFSQEFFTRYYAVRNTLTLGFHLNVVFSLCLLDFMILFLLLFFFLCA